MDAFFNNENFTTRYGLITTTFDNENFTTRYDLRTDRWELSNSSAQGYIKNNTDANLTTLTVENITSPFVNKSYIFFESDGSVGIMLDPILPIVSAQEEIQSTETKEFTRGTERTSAK